MEQSASFILNKTRRKILCPRAGGHFASKTKGGLGYD